MEGVWPYNNRWVIKKWSIPKNFMFIGSPGDRFSYRVAELEFV
jgi:hypothetical protein